MAATTPAPRVAQVASTPPTGLVRALAAAALLAQLLFVAGWLVAGALEPGYDHVEQTVSELGARTAAHPWIVNTAFVLLGVSVAALAAGVLRVLPRSRARLAAALGFAVSGACLAAAGLLPLDCPATIDAGCERALLDGDAPWQTYAHGYAGLLSRVAFLVTPFAIAAALWPRPAGALALACGAIGVALGVAGVVFWWIAGGLDSSIGGFAERVELLPLHLWVAIVAAGVLYGTRRPPALPTPTPLPPRRLYAASWSGDGEAMAWPPAIGRLMPVRFAARRVTRWLDDRTWTFDDEAVFSRGWTQRRQRFCRIVAPDLVRVTSDDLPDGVDVRFDDDGYRIAPYTMLIPVGPVRLPVRCRQSGRVEGERLVETVRCSFLGLPVAVVELRVAPVES
jgi:Protein of unknown function (DUF998)